MSCLFNAITKLMQNELRVVKINDLRKFICDYMENNLDKILKNDTLKGWLENISLDKYNQVDVSRYINEMRSNSVWGGAPEIAITSKIFQLEIIVNYGGSDIAKFNNCDGRCYKRLYLQWTGGHYEPIKVEKIDKV